jgi:pimeloyl-ACP methyl ester carboxylesterase
MKTLRYVLLLLLSTGPAQAEEPPPAATAADVSAAATTAAPTPPAIEQEVVARLRASPAAADAQELTADGKPVMALWRAETLGQAQGAVVLLHDIGAHADWPGVVGPLRQELPRHGWHTLSLQLAAAEETPARLRAALAFLAGKNIRNIILLGHGAGAQAALRHAVDNKGSVNGLVLIAMGQTEDPTLLEQAAVPIYDIYGSADRLEVRTAGAQRLSAGRRLVRRADTELPRYRQFVVEAADHFFNRQTGILQRRVQGWLRSHAEGMEIRL